MIDLHAYYRGVIARQRKWAWIGSVVLLIIFIAATLAKDAPVLTAVGSIMIAAAALVFHNHNAGKYRTRLRLLESPFPSQWHLFLEDRSTYYNALNSEDKKLFAMRVLFFLAEIQIDGVDTEADDTVKLLVAASAIIPTFAFPYFDYPNLHNVLVYPEAFNERFETDVPPDRDETHSSGMVGTGFMNFTVLLSRRELMAGFSGTKNTRNVGIHEFVHLLDKADGMIDGVPAIMMDQSSIPSWLDLVEKEMKDIERGRSDIDTYALTDRGEFFAVVCEYYFNNPERFNEQHPELYKALCGIFLQTPGAFEQ
jgi:MtfA peptidase